MTTTLATAAAAHVDRHGESRVTLPQLRRNAGVAAREYF
jgi:hypothetical protein